MARGKGVVEGRGGRDRANGQWGLWDALLVRRHAIDGIVRSRRSFTHPQLYFQALNSNSRFKHMLATDKPESDSSRNGLIIPRRLSSSYCYAENLLPVIFYHLFQSKRHYLICILNGF